MQSMHHVLLLGPVGAGKTFFANAMGNIACRRGFSVIMTRAERLFKELKVSRLDNTYEREMRRVLSVDLETAYEEVDWLLDE